MMTKPNIQTALNIPSDAGAFASLLFEIEVNAHVAHLQTTSFAFHMATDELYKGMVDLRDAFIEAFQGKKGIIKGYKNITINESVDFQSYLKGCMSKIESYRSTLVEGYLQQLVDNIQEQLSTTLYKITNLK